MSGWGRGHGPLSHGPEGTASQGNALKRSDLGKGRLPRLHGAGADFAMNHGREAAGEPVKRPNTMYAINSISPVG